MPWCVCASVFKLLFFFGRRSRQLSTDIALPTLAFIDSVCADFGGGFYLKSIAHCECRVRSVECRVSSAEVPPIHLIHTFVNFMELPAACCLPSATFHSLQLENPLEMCEFASWR